MARFTFTNQTIIYKEKTYIVDGQGDASVDVSGSFGYIPETRLDPAESWCDIDDVKLIEIDELEITNLKDSTEEEYQKLSEDEEFIQAVVDQINEDNLEYDDNDLQDCLAEQLEDYGPDY